MAKKVDLDTIPQIKGQSIFEYDLEAADKLWKLPGKCWHQLLNRCALIRYIATICVVHEIL